ncbi:cytochrome P450 [Hygrophoropsis aurantiaca]|uniref:Cytochrome P450 n=1 Tax=Hygrophoropsis aurantiaca TaxID=72124 RepID=A0ACB8A7R9_9AGAM|nr:cytochrome P450 [Hygrophoropsis aurantiaca]
MITSIDTRFTLILSLSAIAIALVDRLARKKRATGGLPLPPGPTGLPIVGSLLSLDSRGAFYTYLDWAATYGDLVYAKFLKEEIIIINSRKIAVELLEKRSNNYSDRPYLAALIPFGWNFNFGNAHYGDYWRVRRKLFHQTFRPESVAKFRPMQLTKVHQLLANMLDESAHYVDHLESYTASIAMAAVYGYETKPRNDPLVAIANKAIFGPLKVLAPEGTALVNAFPFLLRLPNWFPGATIARNARSSYYNIQDMIDAPHALVQKKMINGTETPSLVSDMLQRLEEEEPENKPAFEKILKDVSSTTIAAASESSTAVLVVFVLAMVMHPEVQERARAQIDAVVGSDRLPDFEDRESLPYIDAILWESMRWEPVTPIALPHSNTTSDVYEGYFIPKGATIVANAWAMSRDESVYPNASEFQPERWLTSDGQLNGDEPPNFVFGWGRRICPGRHAADATMWVAICSLLANFDFQKAKDSRGKTIDFKPTFTAGFVRLPDPFPSHIVPRPGFNSDKLAHLIRMASI